MVDEWIHEECNGIFLFKETLFAVAALAEIASLNCEALLRCAMMQWALAWVQFLQVERGLLIVTRAYPHEFRDLLIGAPNW